MMHFKSWSLFRTYQLISSGALWNFFNRVRLEISHFSVYPYHAHSQRRYPVSLSTSGDVFRSGIHSSIRRKNIDCRWQKIWDLDRIVPSRIHWNLTSEYTFAQTVFRRNDSRSAFVLARNPSMRIFANGSPFAAPHVRRRPGPRYPAHASFESRPLLFFRPFCENSSSEWTWCGMHFSWVICVEKLSRLFGR